MIEQRKVENQVTNREINKGTSNISNLEVSEAPPVSGMIAQKGGSEVNLQTTNIETPQKDGDQPVRRGATGPRTEIGKKRSSQNAVKSGIFSRATLLKGESRTEYESLREGLWKSLQPGNEFEEFLLDKITSNLWRQRRVLIAEGAEIRRNSEFMVFDRRQKELKEAEEISQKRQAGTVSVYASEPVGVGLIWTIENPHALERCIEILIELRQGIEANGFDEMKDKSLLKTIYGDPHQPHLRQTLQDQYSGWHNTAKVTEKERMRKGWPSPEQCKQNVLREIGAEINGLKQYKDKHESIESKRREVEILRQRVPDSPGLDRLLRYETNRERDFDRMLTQYDRAQRMRKGQPLPPQLDVKIS
jgi:hypothetical protein